MQQASVQTAQNTHYGWKYSVVNLFASWLEVRTDAAGLLSFALLVYPTLFQMSRAFYKNLQGQIWPAAHSAFAKADGAAMKNKSATFS